MRIVDNNLIRLNRDKFILKIDLLLSSHKLFFFNDFGRNFCCSELKIIQVFQRHSFKDKIFNIYLSCFILSLSFHMILLIIS